MKYFVFIYVLILFASCREDMDDVKEESVADIPQGFPLIEFPQDNEYTPERWSLGKRLFFDPILSRDSTLSCASCHKPELAFSDGLSLAKGIEGRIGMRNAPTLANVAYQPYYTFEGGVPTLEMQVLVPVQEHAEFDFNILLIAEKLNTNPSYVAESWLAYERSPDPFVITRALATFERTLISGHSRYDDFIHGDELALSPIEKKGKDLFFSERTNCAQCHAGFNFTDYSFKNNGLYDEYPDLGRFRLTGQDEDLALFKVPSLRNISITPPYMHDGTFNDLGDVIEHYNEGGKSHPQKSSLIHELHLDENEKYALEKFLESLTDDAFITNVKFRNP